MDNASGRVVKTRKPVHETVAAFLKRAIADRKRYHFQQKKAAVCSLFCWRKLRRVIVKRTARSEANRGWNIVLDITFSYLCVSVISGGWDTINPVLYLCDP